MILTKPVVEAALETLAEICGKAITQKHKDLFFNRLQYGRLFEMRNACEYFAARGQFPTLNEMLTQMGLSQVASRDAVEAAKARESEAQRKESSQKHEHHPEDYASGFWTFRDEIQMPAGFDAKAELELKKRVEYTEQKGWTILDVLYNSGKREMIDGKHVGTAWIYSVMIHCYREKPRLQHIEEKKQWPAQSV